MTTFDEWLARDEGVKYGWKLKAGYKLGARDGWNAKQAEIDRLRGVLIILANGDFNSLSSDPSKWPSTIAQRALEDICKE